MKNSSLKWILATLAGSFILSACGGDGESGSPQPLIGDKPYNIGSCEHNPETGQSMQNFNRPTPVTNSGFFDKQFLFEPFEASLKSSSLSLAQVLQREGVSLYQVSVDPAASCRYFDFLFEAPTQKQKSWDSVTFSNKTGSTLLGLFTTYYNKNKENLNVHLSESTIMVRNDTQKWTLIHEMAHYLFARGRITEVDMPFNKDLEGQIDKKQDNIETLKERFESKPNAGLAQKIINNYAELFELMIELDGRGPLEEFTIEAMLSDRAQKGEITNINIEYDVNNSFNYMSSNSSIVLPTYRIFRRGLENYDFSAFPKKEKNMKVLIAHVQGTIDFIVNHLNQVRGTRRRFLNPTGLTQASFETSSEVNHHHFDLEKVKAMHDRMRNFLK